MTHYALDLDDWTLSHALFSFPLCQHRATSAYLLLDMRQSRGKEPAATLFFAAHVYTAAKNKGWARCLGEDFK